MILGVALLLGGPLIELTPFYKQLQGGCPCPNGVPITVIYPFHYLGVAAWIGGATIVALFVGSTIIKRRRAKATTAIVGPASYAEIGIAVFSGLALLALSGFLSQIDLTGPPSGPPFNAPSYQVYAYGPFALYPELYGYAMILFAAFAYATRQRIASIFLSVGIVICGLSFDLLSVAYYEATMHSSDFGQIHSLEYTLAAGLSFVIGGILLTVLHRRAMNERAITLQDSNSKMESSQNNIV
jgi:hypothetical protein